MRKAAQIAGAAAIAALLLSGCGSSSEGGEESKPSPSKSAGGEDKAAGSGDLAGAWQTETSGQHITLAIIGETATLGAGKTACQGKVQDMGAVMLALKCSDGDDTRSMGTVQRTGDKLRVSWENGPTEEYTKTEGQVKIPKPSLPSTDS